MNLKVLGSVSPYPKGKNNGVSFLIKTKYDNQNIILDLGSGSTRLLDMTMDLDNLIVIISHLHKDHYTDISALAYASFVGHKLGYVNKRIKVYIPKCEELIDYKYLMNYGNEHYLEFIPYDALDLNIGKETHITSNYNPHDIISNSIKIEDSGISIVYSGDTGYENNTLKTFAKDADLLVCESSFIKGQAKSLDNHLFAYEAGLIAKEAKVHKLMLTHFYPEIDKQKYVDEAKNTYFSDGKVFAAEENDEYVVSKSLIYKIG